MEAAGGPLFTVGAVTRSGDEFACELRFPRASRYFAGHFADAPLLPGVALLVVVEQLIRRHLPACGPVRGAQGVRFRTAVPPDALLSCRIRSSGSTIHFALHDAATVVANGSFEVAHAG